jgi:hypothetical protein
VRSPAIAAAILLLAGCAAGPPGPIHPPSWLASSERPEEILRIRETATFAGPRRLRVCRRIENISPQPVLIYNLSPEGDNHQELSVDYYDRHGEWIAPPHPAGFHHESFSVPPPPASEDDISIYTIMAPGQSVENCAEQAIEPGLNIFQVVTYYEPTAMAEFVPARVQAENRVLTNQLGFFASQPCLVDVRRRRIDCALRAR